VSVDGTDVVLLRVDGAWRAYQGRCPHQGALLGEGELEGAELVCRNHRWRFDARTGERRGGAGCLRACEVRADGDALLVSTAALAADALAAASPVPARPLRTVYGSFEIERVGRAEDVKGVYAVTVAPRGQRVRVRRRQTG
jgi:nitrite reductase/ring-hydroxylating ferredoxin subunit